MLTIWEKDQIPQPTASLPLFPLALESRGFEPHSASRVDARVRFAGENLQTAVVLAVPVLNGRFRSRRSWD